MGNIPQWGTGSKPGALHTKRAGGTRLETSQRDLATTPLTNPVAAGLDLGQCRVDTLNRGEDRTSGGRAGDPLDGFGRAVTDSLPERNRGPGFRWLHETVQLRAQSLPAQTK